MISRIYDLHMHTFHSDGILSPMELLVQAERRSYEAACIADHCGAGGIERLIAEISEDCELASERLGIIAVPGIELTHVPPSSIDRLASKAKSAGARLIIVHGETPFEGVQSGTNRAAIKCPDVDILAHPGIITEEDVKLAKETDTYLEISGRRDHCLANGRVASLARSHGARLLINSDAHHPGDLFSLAGVRRVALGAGLSEEEAYEVLHDNPITLLRRAGYNIS